MQATVSTSTSSPHLLQFAVRLPGTIYESLVTLVTRQHI